MKVDLISFQDKAVKELRLDIADALSNYQRRGKTQVDIHMLGYNYTT